MLSNWLFKEYERVENNGVRKCRMYFNVELHKPIEDNHHFNVAYVDIDGEWMELWKYKDDYTNKHKPTFRVTLNPLYKEIKRPRTKNFYDIFKYRERQSLWGFLDCEFQGKEYYKAELKFLENSDSLHILFYDIAGLVAEKLRLTEAKFMFTQNPVTYEPTVA